MTHNPRLISLEILNALDEGQKTLDNLMASMFARASDISQLDKNLLITLVYGVLRNRKHLDWILSHFSKKELEKLDPEVLNILRIGLFQILYLSRIPTSAAVNTSVELSKTLQRPWISNFVNAVLRNAVRGYEKLSLPDMEKDIIPAISIQKSMPEWLMTRWVPRFGISGTIKLCDTINTVPFITLRTNDIKTTRDSLLKSLKTCSRQVVATSFSPHGIRLNHLYAPIFSHESFKKGFFQVQDEAAQLVTFLLDPQPGERILDACAGMGGKTGHIAQQMKNKGNILAIDISPNKLAKIDQEMKRLGISIVETCVQDICEPAGSERIGKFDRALLDSPCSGLGVLRRNPDIKWRSSMDRIKECSALQIQLLDNLSRHVKPSGILVYSVCSIEPEENEAVVENFLKRHPDFVIDKKFDCMPQNSALPITSDGFLRTLPHIHNMDGFFAARFMKMEAT